VIYEYKCNHCDREFEETQKMSDPPIEKCEKCGGSVTRLISGAPAFILKGTGWYKDGYK
jgi:putative FmdB family regulatory protein